MAMGYIGAGACKAAYEKNYKVYLGPYRALQGIIDKK